MLIDFTVENYRSIKEPVTLSAIAQPGRVSKTTLSGRSGKSDDAIAQPYEVEGRGFGLLPVLAIYGANAAGKSNVIKAIADLLQFMRSGRASSQRVSSEIFTPFRLDHGYINQPTKFILRAEVNGRIYKYSLSVTRDKIIREKLEYVRQEPGRANAQLLFDRSVAADNETYTWKNGSALPAGMKSLQASIRTDQPFVAILHKFDFDPIKDFSYWLNDSMSIIDTILMDDGFLSRMLFAQRGQKHAAKIENFVKYFDTNIDGIELKFDNGNEIIAAFPKVNVTHDSLAGKVEWLIDQESAGTRRIFSLSMPIILALETGATLIVDELADSLHPLVLRKLIEFFQSSKTNPKRAQLIFTSHDNSIMRGDLLRRDQIWLTKKRNDRSTDLYPLSDFRPRNDLALDKAYLDGRFGAIPILSEADVNFVA